MSTTTTTTWLLLLRFWGGVALFFSFVLLQRPVVGFDQQESTSHHLALEALPLPSPSPPPPPLRVHVVPHSHDDSGWLKTYLQYYWGDAQHIQVAGVKTILDSVVDALVVNPSRKFSFAEMSFFMLWWGQQSDAKKAVVRTLVAQGRLDFVNGGFVQHDEASAHYVAMIDQTTRGHLFLKKEFGFVPRVGWQIDPFGHSSSSAGLLGRGLGFDALFFGRADWEDMAVRKARKQLEFLWKGSGGGPMTCDGDDDADNGGDNGLLFTGNFASGNYGPPEGFNFEFGISDTPIQDDPSLRGFNVEERVEAFVAACEALAGMTRGNEIMLTMGSDFHYAAAEGWFGNLDRLMAAVNARGDDNDENGVGTTTANGRGRRVEVFYSTPYAYVKAKAREAMTDGVTYPVKVDDFFPYSDAPEAFWTGYFTSRPTSKRYIRMATSFLQAARQLEAFVGAQGSCLRGTDPLEEAVALTQHHDSVTGTERQAVADDYHIWISEGMEAAREVVGKAFTAMYGRGDDGADEDGALDGHHHWCPLLNVSSCEFTVERDAFTVTVYNPTSFDREIPVSVPVSLEACDVWRASGPDGGAIDVDVVVNAKAGGEDITNHHHHRRADANVVFLAPVQAMGMASFLVSGAEDASQDAAENNSGSETLSISNDLMRLEFDPVSGLAQSIAFLAGNATAVLPFTVELAYYNSSDGLDSQINRGQSSGAYIFRPNGGKYDVREPGTKRVTLEIIHGAVVSEARQTFNEWGSLVTRLYKHKPYLEVEWTAGPLPLDAVGREVVVVYRGPPSLSDLWTDANGRAMIRRPRNARFSFESKYADSIAANYMPVTAAAVLQDAAPGGASLAVLTDRAHGAASLRDGELEVMLHRRTIVDDGRGVEEPLNERQQQCTPDGECREVGLIARGRHHVLVEYERTARSGMRRRQLQQELNDDPVVAFGPPKLYERSPAPVRSTSLLGNDTIKDAFAFPLHVLTLQETNDRTSTERTLFIRVGHQMDDVNTIDGGRPRWLSSTDLVQLARNVGCQDIVRAKEVSLSGNQDVGRGEGGRPRFQASEEVVGDVACEQVWWVDRRRAREDGDGDGDGNVVESDGDIRFDPMEIKTFEVVCRREH